MLMPRIFEENLFDDWFDFPELPELNRAEKKLYGHRGNHLMKTDVHEKENTYELEMDLPGFHREDLQLTLENGTLTVRASKSQENETEEKGKLLRRERYSGSMQRSFYVGEGVQEEDIHAAFHNGVLCLTIPKKETPKLPEKKQIPIEGE